MRIFIAIFVLLFVALLAFPSFTAELDTHPVSAIVLLISALALIAYELRRMWLKFKSRMAHDELYSKDASLFAELAPLVAKEVRVQIAADERPSPLKENYISLTHAAMIVVGNELRKEYETETGFTTPTMSWLTKRNGANPIEGYASLFSTALARYTSKLPAYVKEPAIFRAQLGAIPHYKAIEDFHFTFHNNSLHFLWSMYQQKHETVKEQTAGKFYEWGDKTFYQRLTSGLPFSPLFEPTALVPITIPDELRFRGVYILAPQGKGKTTLLGAILKKDLERVKKGGASVILMDSKGALIDAARQLKDIKDKIVLIEPSPTLAINPLDLGATGSHTIELLEYLFSGLFETAPSEKQLTLLRSVLLAMTAIPHATIFTLREMLAAPIGGYQEYDLSLMHPDDRAFFTSGKFDSKTYKDTKEELDWRIQSLITKIPVLRDMFKAPKTRLDLGKEMDAGRLIIIDNSEAKLGKAGAEFFGRFFLALTLAAAQQRARKEDDEKLPCFLYIDECDTVIAKDRNIYEMIKRCRSQKVGVVLAHQYLVDIKSLDVKAALMNCAVRFANTDDEAPDMAPRMRTTPEHLRSLHDLQFALFMSDLTKDALTITVPPDYINKWPKMSAPEMVELRKEMEAKYHYTRQADIPQEEPSTEPQGWRR